MLSFAMASWLPELLLATQLLSASIQGTVTDAESGAAIAGAAVIFPDAERSAVTDSSGRYALEEIPAGPQHVEVRRVGYAARAFHALAPREGTLVIDVALSPSPIVLQPVDVSAPVPIRGVEKAGAPAFPDRGLSIAAVRQHPLLAEPDLHLATGGGEVTLHPESPKGIHVRGGSADQTAHLLDDVPVLSPYHAAGTFSAWNPDAVARVDLFSAASPPWLPESLSGVIRAATRPPGSRFETRGSVSTTQARVTVDGPLGAGGAGYLLGTRFTFPGLLPHKNDPDHLRGESGDALAKLESPLLGGGAYLLAYGSTTEIVSRARACPCDDETDELPKNALSWESTSLGAGWTGTVGGARLDLDAWTSALLTEADWGDSLADHLGARYREAGATAMLQVGPEERRTTAGVRASRGSTSYKIRREPAADGALDLDGTSPLVSAFAAHAATLAGTKLDLAATATHDEGTIRFSPSLGWRWRPSRALGVTAFVARRHQYVQSLRNTETIVGTIFPADLAVAAGVGGVPVASTAIGILAVEHEPSAGIHLGAQVYTRDFDGLALVAPREFGPFATTGFVEGEGAAHGFSLEASAAGARVGVIAAYALQHVRFSYGDTTFVPEHGATHSLEAGINVFPTATSSVRLGIVSAFGRRATAIVGPFEWEACNLLDLGCEFSGSPTERAGPLGAERLPPYVRVDLGVRKHWHVTLSGRDVNLAVFASATNLLGRRNVLTIVVDPETGDRQPIEMRPRSPLVAGLEWRF